MEPDQSASLIHQCHSRIAEYQRQNSLCELPDSVDNLAKQVALLVKRNLHRIPAVPAPNPDTRVPDAYLDDIIRAFVEEGPRIQSLLLGDEAAWQNMLTLLYRRVAVCIRSLPVTSDIDELADDCVYHCAEVLLAALDRYPFDTPLDAWVSALVAYELSTLRRSADFRHNMYVWSLDAVNGDDNQLTLGEMVPDHQATQHFMLSEARLLLTPALADLSDDQREVILRTIRGETTQEIAMQMRRSCNAIYQIKNRAIKRLRSALTMETDGYGGRV